MDRADLQTRESMLRSLDRKHRKATLLELAGEFEKAPEDSPELYAKLYRALWPDNGLLWWKAGWTYVESGAYLCAATALVREKLPDWAGDLDICASFSEDGGFGARLFPPGEGHMKSYAGVGKTPELGLCAAFLRALAQEQDHGR